MTLPIRSTPESQDVDRYLEAFPPDVQFVLRQIRATIRQAAPEAEERISYRMPAFFQDGVLIYFGAFKQHIGLFPPVADEALRLATARYAGPKGNLKLPLSEPMPLALIGDIVKARLQANRLNKAAKAQAKKRRAIAR